MIGISSYAFHDLPLSAALEKIEGMSECAEIYSEGLHDIFRHAQTPLSYNLKYSVHAPTTDLNIASIREPIRQASLELVRQAVDICTRIDAEMLVVHPGYFSYSYDLPAAKAALNRSIGEFADISGDTGVQICIENMPNWECFLFRQPSTGCCRAPTSLLFGPPPIFTIECTQGFSKSRGQHQFSSTPHSNWWCINILKITIIIYYSKLCLNN